MNARLNILHLEDDPLDFEIIHDALSKEQIECEITRVESKEEFVRALESADFDLILADFRLPSFDGTSALAINQERKDPSPFIFVSGTIGEDAAIESLKRGATDYVLKNRLDRLVPSVRRALREAVEQTERKRFEEQIREQAAWLDLAQDAIIVRDMERRTRFWSKGAERLYGWTAAEMVGSSAQNILFCNESTYDAAKTQVIEKGQWIGELQKLTKGAQKVVVMSRWTLLKDAEAKARSILWIDTDISEKKRLEAQLLRVQRMESIGRLASGIAHDLNNVLSPILFSVPMLRWGLEAEEFERTLRTIEASAKRGAEVVKQLLTYGRGIAGERVPFHPKDLIEEMGKMINQTFPKNIEFMAQIPKELWPITGDATQLHQVLMNLCVNARDAMPSGGKLMIKAKNIESDEHYAIMSPNTPAAPHVLISVSDTGSGIAPEIVEHIFDPFFTTKEIGKGSGLGLSSALGIVKSHGGLINVTSVTSKGSTFDVFLPASPEAMLSSSKVSALSIPRGKNELILLVDDEFMIREVTRKTLEKHGYQVLTASDGVEGIAIYAGQRGKIKLVLTDIIMPEMDGVSLAKAIRRMDPKARIIASSGIGQDEQEKEKVEELRSFGMNTFLTKPYTADQMLTAIHAAVSDEPTKVLTF